MNLLRHSVKRKKGFRDKLNEISNEEQWRKEGKIIHEIEKKKNNCEKVNNQGKIKEVNTRCVHKISSDKTVFNNIFSSKEGWETFTHI